MGSFTEEFARIWGYVLAIFFICIFLMMVFLFVMLIIDSFTLEELGTERVKCIDEEGNPFEDEWCFEDVTCSRFRYVSDNKCSEMSQFQRKAK